MNFLEELEQLRLATPRLYNINIGSENSDYCTHSDKNKNCYLIFAANYNEDSMYGRLVIDSRDCVDNNNCEKSELCYECIDIEKCYDCTFCQLCKNCTECLFCYDCTSCMNCFGCAGLRQKQWCFFNEQLTPEEYKKKLTEFNLRTNANRNRAIELSHQVELKIPHRALTMINCENCVGDMLVNCKNCFACFDVHGSQDCMYMTDCWRTKDSLDIVFSDGTELCYESFSLGLGSYNCNFCNFIRGSSDCEYCELCFNCKNCFGCVGLQNKEFHILNKPYSREEYLKRVVEIKAQMRVNGEYGKHLETTYKFEDTAAAD